jgi:hypothetical protein
MSHSNRPPAVSQSSSPVQEVVYFEALYFDLPWCTLSDRRHPMGENSWLITETGEDTFQRLHADDLISSPKLTYLQRNALQGAQNSESFRLQQLYQSIRNLEDRWSINGQRSV